MNVTQEDGRAETLRPTLSEVELARLRFLAYLRQSGQLRPAGPVVAGIEALCARLLRGGPASDETEGPQRELSRGSLPLLWQRWAELQQRRGA
jgi:hypothetical protein